MSRYLWPGLLLLSLACAEIEEVKDGSVGNGRIDALVGFTNDTGTFDGASPPSDAAQPRPDAGPVRDQFVPDQAVGPCTEGQNLGLCSVCNANSAPEAPERDPNCPNLNCEAHNFHQVGHDDGDTTCEIITHAPTGPSCSAVGRCREADRVVCVARPGVEVARTEAECQVISGCNGDIGPTIEPAPAGTPCEAEAGLCTPNGRCDTTIIDECSTYLNLALICGAGVLATGIAGPYCAVSPEEEVESCLAFCSRFGTICMEAYQTVGQGCVRGEQISCRDQADEVLCLCRRN